MKNISLRAVLRNFIIKPQRMKFKFKKGLIAICVHYFFMFIGLGLTYPYLTLQMLSLGLTLSDAGLVNGLSPIVGFFFAPFMGYMGDKFGYKLVFLLSTTI